MGRPKGSVKQFDHALVEQLAAIGCTQEEIGTIVGVTDRTLRKRASDAIAKGHDRMRVSLRRWQYEKAKDGNVAMLIWLGKQYLGQRERIDETRREEVVTIERIAPKIGLADTA